MSAAKQEITASIRRALGQRSVLPALGYAAIQREYKQGGSLAAEDRLNMFAERLHDYDAVLHRCSEENIAETIARILLARDKRTMLVSNSVPAAWRPAGFAFIEDRGLTYGEIDRSEGVLTTCSVAIAVTGTIVLRHSKEEGRRAITLIPDYHLCVVHASQLVETVPEGIRMMRSFAGAPITTISGPSATSDIEMTRIKGVHGPRVLEVVLTTD